MKWKMFIIIYMLLVLLFSLPIYAHAEKIALIMKAFTNPFFIKMKDGALKTAEKLHLSLDYFSIKYETDIDSQIKIIKNIMESGEYRGILIAPADSKRLIPLLKQAIDRGIKVINLDNKLDNETLQKYHLKIPFVGPDNFKGGEKIGEYVKNKLKGKGNVIIMEGIPSAINAIERRKGFLKGLSKSNIKVITFLVANWHQDEAFNKLLSFFKNYYGKIDAILCANDEMALGAVQALYFLEKNHTFVTGYDNIDEIRPLLWSKKVYATIEQHPFEMGKIGVEEMAKLLNGENIPLWRKISTDLITYETFGKKIGIYFSSPISFSKKIIKNQAEMNGEETFIITMPELIPTLGLDLLIVIGNDKKDVYRIKNINSLPILFIKYSGESSPNLEKKIGYVITNYFRGMSYNDFFKEVKLIKRK